MIVNLIEEGKILARFVAAIEYGDYSGLSDDGESALDDWLENYPNCIFEYSAEIEFSECEITGWLGDCVNVKIYKGAE